MGEMVVLRIVDPRHLQNAPQQSLTCHDIYHQHGFLCDFDSTSEAIFTQNQDRQQGIHYV